jgi:hypothetical protein
MLRKLLTLIALCAGLAAVGEPARASIGVVDTVRLMEQTSRACLPAAPAASLETAPRTLRSDDRGKICPRPVLTIVVPTVMLQSDRAHE